MPWKPQLILIIRTNYLVYLSIRNVLLLVLQLFYGLVKKSLQYKYLSFVKTTVILKIFNTKYCYTEDLPYQILLVDFRGSSLCANCQIESKEQWEKQLYRKISKENTVIRKICLIKYCFVVVYCSQTIK